MTVLPPELQKFAEQLRVELLIQPEGASLDELKAGLWEGYGIENVEQTARQLGYPSFKQLVESPDLHEYVHSAVRNSSSNDKTGPTLYKGKKSGHLLQEINRVQNGIMDEKKELERRARKRARVEGRNATTNIVVAETGFPSFFPPPQAKQSKLTMVPPPPLMNLGQFGQQQQHQQVLKEDGPSTALMRMMTNCNQLGFGGMSKQQLQQQKPAETIVNCCTRCAEKEAENQQLRQELTRLRAGMRKLLCEQEVEEKQKKRAPIADENIMVLSKRSVPAPAGSSLALVPMENQEQHKKTPKVATDFATFIGQQLLQSHSQAGVGMEEEKLRKLADYIHLLKSFVQFHNRQQLQQHSWRIPGPLMQQRQQGEDEEIPTVEANLRAQIFAPIANDPIELGAFIRMVNAQGIMRLAKDGIGFLQWTFNKKKSDWL